MDDKKVITKLCLDIIFREWEYTDVSPLGISPEDVINVIEFEGKTILIYWTTLKQD